MLLVCSYFILCVCVQLQTAKLCVIISKNKKMMSSKNQNKIGLCLVLVQTARTAPCPP